ncbi:MAG: OprD family outer membrane porin [Campylobacterota bacterium]|nr:OprD family outer membrane porin [Campylobacterota bacterium]
MILFIKQILHLSIIFFLLPLYLNASSSKRVLKSNMIVDNQTLPKNANNFTELFTEGFFYGRLRFNSFGFQWDDELVSNDKVTRKDHAIAALGGSLLYKSAYLNGFAFTAGFYFSQAFGTLNDNEAYLYKAGKGALSRYKSMDDGQSGMASLAQVYLEYRHRYFEVKAGRLLFESFLTKSNDTKMIPNTFEGVTLETQNITDTKLKMAYLTKQKLRDHTEFHHVLAYADKLEDEESHQYTQNDDTAMHLGLTESKLATKGIDNKLIVLDVKNKSIDNLLLKMNYTAVPNLVSSMMIQADYKMMWNNLSVTPALRYMQQFDNGAGAIGGANLKTNTVGYEDPNSLESWLLGLRVDVAQDAWKLRFGYTQVADEGDIVAPWRGFPTGGFTRMMAQYNWYANTKTYMLRADYDFDKAGLISKLKGFMRLGFQDFDNDKEGVQADSYVVTLDLLKEFESIPNLYMKFRMANVWGNALDNGTIQKLNPSYDEARLEFNYLF